MAFKAFERFDLESLTMIVGQGALLVVGFAVLQAGYGLIGFAAVFAAVRLADLAATFALLRRRVAPVGLRLDIGFWPTLLRGGLMFGAIALLNDMAFRIDTVLLGFWASDAQIGWYKAAYKIPEGMTEIPVIVAWTLLPALSVAHTRSREEVVDLFRRGAKMVMLAGLPLAAFIALRAEDVVQIAFGASFAQAVPVLRVLMLSVPAMFLTWVASSVLMSIDHARVTLYRSAVALSLNVVLNLILIPRIGIMGAAVATVATELAAAVLVTSYLFANGYGFGWSRLMAKAGVATIALVAVALLLRQASLLATAPLAFAAYAATLHVFRVWDAEERQMLMGVIGVFRRQKVAGSEA
jgi:O-antigen/teichoic acid export membrane protein